MEKLYLWHRFNYAFVLFVHAWLTMLHNIAILVNNLCAAVIIFFLPVATPGMKLVTKKTPISKLPKKWDGVSLAHPCAIFFSGRDRNKTFMC